MKKRIQILTIALIFILNVFMCSDILAANKVSTGPSYNQGISSGSSGSNGPSYNQGISSGSSGSNGPSYNQGISSGTNGSNGPANNQGISSGTGGNRPSGGTGGNRVSTGMQLNGKDAQTSVPSGNVDPDAYEPKELTVSDAGEFIDIANAVIGAIRIFGTVVAVVALMALGVKYMLGSTQEKATYKETMIPYLIGAIMVFAIPNIIGIILDLVSQIKF